MQIVINIDEEVYKRTLPYKDLPIISNLANDYPELTHAVANGTPLPKGHGKLIVEPTEEDIAKTVGGQNDFAECIRDSVKAVFDNAPTIIEADKAEVRDK